jgi:hypothetical protein
MESVERHAGQKKLYQIGGFTTIILFEKRLKGIKPVGSGSYGLMFDNLRWNLIF